MVILVRLVQPENTADARDVTLLPRVALVRLVQPAKT
jgi:hypothetical protein